MGKLNKIIKKNAGKSFGVTSKLEVIYYNETYVSCSNRDLIYLNLPNSTYVWCHSNNLTELNCPKAKYVYCYNNNLTELNCPNARYVSCDKLFIGTHNAKNILIKIK